MEKTLLPDLLAFLDSRVLARLGASSAAGAGVGAGASAGLSSLGAAFLVFFTFLSSAYPKHNFPDVIIINTSNDINQS